MGFTKTSLVNKLKSSAKSFWKVHLKKNITDDGSMKLMKTPTLTRKSINVPPVDPLKVIKVA